MSRAPIGALLLPVALASSIALALPPATVAGTAPPAPEGRWLRYPFPGAEIKALAFDPRPGGPVYLGTAQGGVYLSADRGRSWIAPSGAAPFPGSSVTAVVPDPLSPGVVWVGATGILRGGLLARSEDGGRSWSVLKRWESAAGARAVAVTVSGGKRIVAVAGDPGVEVSLDDGRTWRLSRPPLDPGSGIAFLAFAPGKGTVLWAGSFRHPFRSADLGRSWERRAAGMVEDTQVFEIDFSAAAPEELWAATCGWVYRSLDGGTSWTRYRDGLSDRRTHVVRRDPATAGRVLAGTTGGIFETRDAGKSFRHVGPDVVVNALAFDPADPRRLLVGTESDGLLVSEDGGDSFSEANRGLAEARIAAVARTSSGRVVVARAADGSSAGLFSVDPRSSEVTRLPGAPPATVVSLAAAGDRILAATPDGIFAADAPGRPFLPVRRGGATVLLAVPPGVSSPAPLLAVTGDGLAGSREGRTWHDAGLAGPVEGLSIVLVEGADAPTVAALSRGRILFWNGSGWSETGATAAGAGPRLAGGFGRARTARPAVAYLSLGLGTRREGGEQLLSFRGADSPATELLVTPPEPDLPLAGWAGDPRGADGLWIATLGRGLYRYVPGPSAAR